MLNMLKLWIVSVFSLVTILSDLVVSFFLQKVTLWKKLYVIYSFFFVRKVVAHIVTFVFYCVLLPATVLFPEVEVPKWGAVYIPSIITLLNAVGTPRSISLLVAHIVTFYEFLTILFLQITPPIGFLDPI